METVAQKRNDVNQKKPQVVEALDFHEGNHVTVKIEPTECQEVANVDNRFYEQGVSEFGFERKQNNDLQGNKKHVNSNKQPYRCK